MCEAVGMVEGQDRVHTVTVSHSSGNPKESRRTKQSERERDGISTQVISPGPSILLLHAINRENLLACSTGAFTNTRNLTLPQNYTNH